MTRHEFVAERENKQKALEFWAIENFGSWEAFQEFAFVDGKVFELPVSLVPASTYEEWESAAAGQTFSSDLITVENSWIRGFSIADGHNRLKDLIESGAETVKVKFTI